MAETNFDEAAVWYVGRPAEEAVEAAEKLSSNLTLDMGYKHQEIEKGYKAARAEIETRYKAGVLEVETAILKVAREAQPPVSISPESAAAALYTRDALRERVRGMNMTEYQALWERAIADDDKIALRVFYDYGTSLWQHPKAKSADVNISNPAFDNLKARTEQALLTADQQKAYAKLKQLEATQKQLPIAYHAALRQVSSGFVISHQKGGVVNGADRRAQDQMQRIIRG